MCKVNIKKCIIIDKNLRMLGFELWFDEGYD